MLTRIPAAVSATLLATVLIAAGASTANADSMRLCGEELLQLQNDVGSVPITGGKVEKERAGLVKLVEATITLVDDGKTTDAVVKLGNLQTKVDDLEAAERISAESAALLTDDTTSATLCLSSAG
ncbi:hypothetical protein BCL57_003013 [Agromyces flavus]|uniref:Uncharacterized protein n=1 Tax=Agromyces flavus TaxID=589382 RepID=A0A1H1RKT3_9MICO|nr:hypothetical protein [Agromyces flavus]MCP2368834.1 hypothetical protein [Agromyces flavus]GGI48290.1 hypothetical protein GCM10010932_29780 [Agromyces flavus]SDS36397.1 hypothetical protein SAMN04489721_1191 [Agromyces flavus]